MKPNTSNNDEHELVRYARNGMNIKGIIPPIIFTIDTDDKKELEELRKKIKAVHEQGYAKAQQDIFSRKGRHKFSSECCCYKCSEHKGYAKALDDVTKIINEDADIQEYVKVRLKRKLSHSQTDFGVTKLTPSTDLLVHSQGKGTGRGIQSSKSADTHIPKESK